MPMMRYVTAAKTEQEIVIFCTIWAGKQLHLSPENCTEIRDWMALDYDEDEVDEG